MGLLSGCSDDKPAEEPQTANGRPDWMAPPQALQPEPPPQEEQERELIVGVIGPETGEEAAFGLQTIAGVKRAAEIFNAGGGIDGKQIKILHFDDGGDPNAVEMIVEDLIKKRVLAIIAAPTGWATFSPTRLANTSKTVFLAVGTRRRIGHSGPFIFRFALPDDGAVDGLLNYVIKVSDMSRLALITSSVHDHSLTISSEFKQSISEFGGKIIIEADSYDTYTGRQNLDAVIKALQSKASELQAVISTGSAKEAALLAKAMRKAGLKQPLLGSDDLFTEEFLKIGGDDVVGTLLYSSFSPKDEGAIEEQRFTDLSHDAFMIMAEAIKNAGSSKPSKVRDALLSTSGFSGLTGKATFTDEGEPVKQPFLYRVEKKNGKNRFILLKQ